MFMVWDGNHRLQAWMPIIEQFLIHDINWHFCVEGVILDPRGDVPSVMASKYASFWLSCIFLMGILGLQEKFKNLMSLPT